MVSSELKTEIQRGLEYAIFRYCDASNNCGDIKSGEIEEKEIIKTQRQLKESESDLRQMVLYAKI